MAGEHDVLYQQMGKLQGQVEAILHDVSENRRAIETRLVVLENHRDNDRLKIARLQWTLGPIGLIGTAVGVVVAKFLKLG